MNILTTALEGTPSASGVKETEITLYGRITQPDGFKMAVSAESQLQAHARYETGQEIRIRRTGEEGQYQYTMTMKERSKEDLLDVSTEHTQDITPDFFEAWLRLVPKDYQVKTRYVFNTQSLQISLSTRSDEAPMEVEIPLVKYEVDVFKKADGSAPEYCKIDIELDGIQRYLEEHYPNVETIHVVVKASSLPFKPVDIITSQSDGEKVKALWENEFTIPVNSAV